MYRIVSYRIVLTYFIMQPSYKPHYTSCPSRSSVRRILCNSRIKKNKNKIDVNFPEAGVRDVRIFSLKSQMLRLPDIKKFKEMMHIQPSSMDHAPAQAHQAALAPTANYS